jgi:ABC-type bacteriocin/lantibiotic exporter with double-glycine peptidase domain
MVSIQRFLNLQNVPQEVSGHEIEVAETWPEKGNIEFKDVTLRYRPTTDAVLKNLEF